MTVALANQPLDVIDGSLVVRKDDTDSPRTVYRVTIPDDELNISYPHTHTVALTSRREGSEDQKTYTSIDNLEPVPPSAELSESKSPDFSLKEGRTLEDVYKDIETLFIQQLQWYESQDIAEKLELEIRAIGYPGDRSLEIRHKCSVGFGDTVTTYALDKSVMIAVNRYRENKILHPLEIAVK